MKTVLFLILILMCSLLSACAAPPPTSAELAVADTASPAPEKRRAPPMSTPYPPREAKPPVQLDYACASSADCAVKNVGNCCGMQPACVNKDSPTDPEAVRAQCEASGTMGICGFRDISACQCVSGRCEPESFVPADGPAVR
jgi:hypothetical protein